MMEMLGKIVSLPCWLQVYLALECAWKIGLLGGAVVLLWQGFFPDELDREVRENNDHNH